MAITRIHHLNCATMCPASPRAVSGTGGWLGRGEMVCHCVLVETSAGLVLVDSGMGTGDCAEPSRFHPEFRAIVQPRFSREETALAQVVALGFAPEDVRHVVVTHLDLDHAGGLPDFPWATVHLHQRELDAARSPRTLGERRRYLPPHFAHGPKWRAYSDEGDPWLGLRAVRLLDGLEELALVPLFGHTRGHSGVAIRDGAGWRLHAGDAYFFHGELEPAPSCPVGLRLFQRIAAVDDAARVQNRDRLAALVRDHGAELRVFSAHDPVELSRLRALSASS